MNIRHLAIGSFVGIALCSVSVCRAQNSTAAPFRIKNIRKELVKAPNFQASGGDLGGRTASLYQDWLKIEVEFESRPEWADDVKLKFYVLLGEGREAKLFVGEVNHINIQKGQHYTAMFVHPNTVQRYGRGKVNAVAIELRYADKLIAEFSDPKATRRWWDDYAPVSGYLLNPLQTPWSVIATERYEPIKATAP